MMLDITAAAALVERCATGVAPATMLGIVQVESGFNPLAIGVNGAPRKPSAPLSADEAVKKAAQLIEAGASVDLGLGQINSANLPRLKLSVGEALDPCKNLAAAAEVLREGYERSVVKGQAPQEALRTALSLYNTGHPSRGLENGYVAKVTAAALRFESAPPTKPDVPVPASPPPAWDIFGRAQAAGSVSLVFTLPKEIAK